MNFFLLVAIISGSLLIAVIIKNAINSNSRQADEKDIEEDEYFNEYKGLVYSKCMLTETEKRYYRKIKELVPETVIVHTQISFNSFLKCEHIDIRNRYNRGVVDIVLTDQDFNVLVIVEIDDDSHTSRRIKAKDRVRDEITSGAGISTLRIDDSVTDPQLLKLLKRFFPKQPRKKATRNVSKKMLETQESL